MQRGSPRNRRRGIGRWKKGEWVERELNVEGDGVGVGEVTEEEGDVARGINFKILFFEQGVSSKPPRLDLSKSSGANLVVIHHCCTSDKVKAQAFSWKAFA